MAADFNKPTVSDVYTAVPGMIRDNDAALATMHETDASSNKPTGAKQITAAGIIKRWNGSSWVQLADPAGHAGSAATAGHTGLGTAAAADLGTTDNLYGHVPVFGNADPFFVGAHVNSPAVFSEGGAISGYDVANHVLITNADKNADSQAIATGFNKALGTTAGTVAEGNHTHGAYSNINAVGYGASTSEGAVTATASHANITTGETFSFSVAYNYIATNRLGKVEIIGTYANGTYSIKWHCFHLGTLAYDVTSGESTSSSFNATVIDSTTAIAFTPSAGSFAVSIDPENLGGVTVEHQTVLLSVWK